MFDWLERSLTFDQYLAHAEMNSVTMRQNFEETEIPSNAAEFFEKLSSRLGPGFITILAISEPWCGDCVENLPVIAKIASLYKCFDLRILPRDENLDIMERYLTDGKPVIPVFVFFDNNGEEIGRFIERPQGAHEFIRQEMAKVSGEPEEVRKKAMYEVRAKLRKLYREGLRDETIQEVQKLLRARYGS